MPLQLFDAVVSDKLKRVGEAGDTLPLTSLDRGFMAYFSNQSLKLRRSQSRPWFCLFRHFGCPISHRRFEHRFPFLFKFTLARLRAPLRRWTRPILILLVQKYVLSHTTHLVFGDQNKFWFMGHCTVVSSRLSYKFEMTQFNNFLSF